VSIYKLEVLLPPDERLGFRREIPASDDAEAIARADEFYDGLAADPNVMLDRYVLYDGQRVVRERSGTKR
jgi:hypothetical protein